MTFKKAPICADMLGHSVYRCGLRCHRSSLRRTPLWIHSSTTLLGPLGPICLSLALRIVKKWFLGAGLHFGVLELLLVNFEDSPGYFAVRLRWLQD